MRGGGIGLMMMMIGSHRKRWRRSGRQAGVERWKTTYPQQFDDAKGKITQVKEIIPQFEKIITGVIVGLIEQGSILKKIKYKFDAYKKVTLTSSFTHETSELDSNITAYGKNYNDFDKFTKLEEYLEKIMIQEKAEPPGVEDPVGPLDPSLQMIWGVDPSLQMMGAVHLPRKSMTLHCSCRNIIQRKRFLWGVWEPKQS